MKKILIALLLMIPVLSGCLVITEIPFAVTIVGKPLFATNHSRINDNNLKEYIICDDKTTELKYSFKFQGALSSWRSYLQGKNVGISSQSDVTLSLNSPYVDYNSASSTVTVSYQISPNSAPRLVGGNFIQPNIGTNPIPNSQLVIEIKQAGKAYSSGDIPVISNCSLVGIP